jgi:hypothetical protein
MQAMLCVFLPSLSLVFGLTVLDLYFLGRLVCLRLLFVLLCLVWIHNTRDVQFYYICYYIFIVIMTHLYWETMIQIWRRGRHV